MVDAPRLGSVSLACALALVFGCGDSGAGEVGDDTGTASESGTAGETNDEVGDDMSTGDGDGETTGEGDGDGDGDTTGEGDGDGDTTGDGDGDTTGDGDGDTTGEGDGDTTGDGDGDTTGDGDGDTTGDGDGDTTGDGDGDTGGDGDPYTNCPNNQDDECLMEEFCYDPVIENWGVCTTDCSNVNDCPAGPPGTVIQCISVDANLVDKQCFISCEGDNLCPEGMICEAENLGADHICVFDN